LVWLALAACSGTTAAPTPTSNAASPPPVAAAQRAFDSYYGSYLTPDGGVLLVTRLGWFADTRDNTYRTLYAGPAPNGFTIGPGFQVPEPVAARVEFGDASLTITGGAHDTTATRVNLRQTEVTIPAAGAQLAGTITEPAGPGPHPGIVVVHGSEPGQRFFYDFWVGLYTSLGLAVLTYDKRGNGASTGRYPGEFPTDESLAIYADDAGAALGFLASWPGIDPKRVGFHGGSQGGWTVPLAIARHGQAAFAVLVSAPAVTVGQQGVWRGFSGNGATLPKESPEEMNAAVRSDLTAGYDPGPALAALKVPALWVLGRNDRTVPTTVSVENLTALKKANISIQLATSGHGLLLNETGLTADDAKAPGLAPEVIPAIRDWTKTATA
jgi:uncharacterized protein